ncbi:ankyrin repeat domain-containing protein [Aspergillus thermomutatus]|uniref:Uncharacterized protein n=1 Tax=Aspergillus thermomutatus TaxID=41047 RepID=A0A397GFQ3_ASPTH|nr:uncharacterized protein CDV56_102604 [Aspergillus thermomutatus]RHZ48634.1 hypothetical protein CDV56_102604 [Aspergillus thermomutatus]
MGARSSSNTLAWAAANGHAGVVRLLLEKGANVDSKHDGERTPLSWAAAYRHETVASLLIDTGRVDPDSRSHYGRTPLSWAAANGHEGVAESLLINDGVNSRVVDDLWSNATGLSSQEWARVNRKAAGLDTSSV